MNPTTIQKDFPILAREINGKRLVYFDNAATTQKPQSVLDAMNDYYTMRNGNIHRGIHTLAEEATMLFEQTRKATQRFINAKHAEEIIFTSGTTMGLNILSRMLFESHIPKGSTVLCGIDEHHANFVPWQQLAKKHECAFETYGLNEDGSVDISDLQTKLSKGNVSVVAVTHVSNVLGRINPVEDISKLAHDHNALCVVDGAQSVPHLPIDVQALDVDFFVFSGHKMLGPTGIGVLYGKKDLLHKLSPAIYGGGMILDVWDEDSKWAKPPECFEAGTPPIAEVVGLHAAIEYLENIGMEEVFKHECDLTAYALEQMSKIDGLTIAGGANPTNKIGVISFVLDDMHAHDLASIMDSEGIAIRSGKHCAHPLHEILTMKATARMSFYVYNTKDDIDRAIEVIEHAETYFDL